MPNILKRKRNKLSGSEICLLVKCIDCIFAAHPFGGMRMKILLLLGALTYYSFAQPSLPVGWRFPDSSDIILGWKEYSKPYFTSADFNNDGLIDEAWLLFNKDSKAWGLFVFLKTRSSTYDHIPLDIDSIDCCAQRMGISVVTPGEYKTACGKGYWDCKDGETPLIILKYPAIDYFMFESANSFFYWDDTVCKFKRIWISD